MSNTLMSIKDNLYPQDALYTSLNQSTDLHDYNAYTTDIALRESVRTYTSGASEETLIEHGARTGSTEVIQWGIDANKNRPILHTYDKRGNRIDVVSYNPGYHNLMSLSTHYSTHSLPWITPSSGSHVIRAAHAYLQTQVDAGHECPIGMTYSCIPTIRLNDSLSKEWLPSILSSDYDPSNTPYFAKSGLTIGMGMTEKQGGSDVRSNTSIAKRDGQSQDNLYHIYGHKWFTSAPMCDAFLVLANTDKGNSCFLVPRWRPDGSKNQIEIQRLKDKLGNVSNASSELVFRGAIAWLVGAEGRGIASIMQMVALTRLDCMIQGLAGQRQALAQAIHHCTGRMVFGKLLIDQPLMRNVLADMQLEIEAELYFLMRMARAIEHVVAPESNNEQEAMLARLGLAVGKYWITKRTSAVTAESLECLGGNGAIEDFINARLYRDAPINAIWEGAGNVQALDIKRAIIKHPRILDALFSELDTFKGSHKSLDAAIITAKQMIGTGSYSDYNARSVIEHLALTMQSAFLLNSPTAGLADLYIQSRLDGRFTAHFGILPETSHIDILIQRANPTLNADLAYTPSSSISTPLRSNESSHPSFPI